MYLSPTWPAWCPTVTSRSPIRGARCAPDIDPACSSPAEAAEAASCASTSEPCGRQSRSLCTRRRPTACARDRALHLRPAPIEPRRVDRRLTTPATAHPGRSLSACPSPDPRHAVTLEGSNCGCCSIPLVSPFTTSFGTETVREVIVVARADRGRRGLGRDRHRRGAALLERVHAGRVGCRRSAGSFPRCSTAATLAAEDVAAIARAVQGPPDGQGRPRDGGARRRAARRGRSLGEYLGAVRDRVPCGRVGRHPARSGDARRGRRAATSTRATCGSSSRSSPAGTSPRRRPCASAFGDDPAAGRRQHRLHARRRRHLAKLDAFDLLLIEQPLHEDDIVGHAELARHAAHPDLPRRVDRVGARPRADAIALGAARSSTSSRAGSAATSRRCAIHDLCRAAGHPGVVRRHARDRASAGPPTSRSPRCRASRCPATSRPRTGSTTATS